MATHSGILALRILWTEEPGRLQFMGFSRQEDWSGLPFPSPGDHPNPGIKPGLLHCRHILYSLSHQGSLIYHKCIFIV